MKKFLIAFLCIFCLLPAMALRPDSLHLIILHTNDTHSRIDPIETDASKNPGKAGVLRRGTLISQIRAQAKADGAEVLLLDAGDFVQGTPYFNLYHGKVEVEMMNRLGYDAVTLGNHEFDRGIPALAKMLSAARFPIVCSNYVFDGTPMQGLTQPYLKLRKGDVQIGIVSAGIDLKNLITPRNRQGLVHLDAVQQADAYAKRLKEEGCDIVICLSHLGFSAKGLCDIKLANNTSYIDVIIGGHSHTFLKSARAYENLQGRQVWVSQMGKDGVYVGRIDMMINVK